MDVRGATKEVAALFAPGAASSYRGELSADGRYDGFGRLTLAGGHEYCGALRDGRMHGLGTLAWSDGVTFVGPFAANAINGCGALTWPDGTEYLGELAKGRRDGFGVQFLPGGNGGNGGARYAGQWKSGRRDGVGELASATALFRGEWRDGRRHGWGVARFASGNMYEGEWRDDRIEGRGVMVWVRNQAFRAVKVPFQATASDTVRATRALVANVGAVSPGPLGPFTPAVFTSDAAFERYVGEWRDGRPHGQGVYELYFHDGSAASIPFEVSNRYSGGFVDGMRDGFGVQRCADGTVYEGQWRANKKHGPGVIIHADGTRDAVEMANDVPVVGTALAAAKRAAEKAAAAGAAAAAGGVSARLQLSAKSSVNNPATARSAATTTTGGGAAAGTGTGSNAGTAPGSPTTAVSATIAAPPQQPAAPAKPNAASFAIEDAIHIDDLFPTARERSEVLELVTRHKTMLKHLFACYGRLGATAADCGAMVQRLFADDAALPLPACASSGSGSGAALPEGVPAHTRNSRIVAAAVNDARARAEAAAAAAVANVTAATAEFNERGGAALAVVETDMSDLNATLGSVILGGTRVESQCFTAASAGRTTSPPPPPPPGHASPQLLLRSPGGGGAARPASSSSATAPGGGGGGLRVGSPSGRGGGRRAPTPMDGCHRTVLDAAPPLPAPPARREQQAHLTRAQMHALLRDALVTDVFFGAAEVNDITAAVFERDPLFRAPPPAAPLPACDLGGEAVPFRVFVECLVRVADRKFRCSGGPLVVCAAVREKLTLAGRVELLFAHYLQPLFDAICEADVGGALQRLFGLPPSPPPTATLLTMALAGNDAVAAAAAATSGGGGGGAMAAAVAAAQLAGDATLPELRRTAIRLLREQQRVQSQSRGRSKGGSAGAAAPAAAAPVVSGATTPTAAAAAAAAAANAGESNNNAGETAMAATVRSSASQPPAAAAGGGGDLDGLLTAVPEIFQAIVTRTRLLRAASRPVPSLSAPDADAAAVAVARRRVSTSGDNGDDNGGDGSEGLEIVDIAVSATSGIRRTHHVVACRGPGGSRIFAGFTASFADALVNKLRNDSSGGGKPAGDSPAADAGSAPPTPRQQQLLLPSAFQIAAANVQLAAEVPASALLAYPPIADIFQTHVRGLFNCFVSCANSGAAPAAAAQQATPHRLPLVLLLRVLQKRGVLAPPGSGLPHAVDAFLRVLLRGEFGTGVSDAGESGESDGGDMRVGAMALAVPGAHFARRPLFPPTVLDDPQLRGLLKACPELAEAVAAHSQREAARARVARAFDDAARIPPPPPAPAVSTAGVSSGAGQWWHVASNVTLTFDDYLAVVARCGAFLFATGAGGVGASRGGSRVGSAQSAGAAAGRRKSVLAAATVLDAVAQLVELLADANVARDAPSAAAATVPPVQLAPPLPVKKKPPPPVDDKAKKKMMKK